MNETKNSWPLYRSILALILAYYATGQFGLLLAIPPGYAAAVWPAAGVALAAVLLYGYRLWPGILLGSFLINLIVSFDGTTSLSILKSIAIAASIGTGAAFQALFGAFLINRYVDIDSGLITPRNVLRFLCLGGLISSVVNSTLGVTTLWLFDMIPATEYFFSWMNWWVGDSIGIIGFLPLIYIFLGRPTKIWRWRKLPVGIPLILMIVTVIILFFMTSAVEQKRIESEFQQRTKVIANSLEKQWISYIEVLHSIQGFITATDAALSL